MFEIRIVCDPADRKRVTTALDRLFHLGAIRRVPSRRTDIERLYIVADHRPEAWPTPQQAYANAPSIADEIGWLTHVCGDPETYADLDREYFLRKAAVLDRVALRDEPDRPHGDATEESTATGLLLMDLDAAVGGCNPRDYVRQQYAQWAYQQ